MKHMIRCVEMKKVTRIAKSKAPLGRPRAFDPEAALERALQVFWRKGYEGASLADLTKAMRINRPSLYAAFGNKEALFLKALDRYSKGPVAFMRQALAESTARAVAERLLRGSADLLTDKRHPSGCLIVQAALACGEDAECIRRELISRRREGEAALRERFDRARSEGDLPADSDPADLARYVITVLHGMAVQAAGSASHSELQRVAEMALRAWPN
jgi:AcrR family transcriptional regulator